MAVAPTTNPPVPTNRNATPPPTAPRTGTVPGNKSGNGPDQGPGGIAGNAGTGGTTSPNPPPAVTPPPAVPVTPTTPSGGSAPPPTGFDPSSLSGQALLDGINQYLTGLGMTGFDSKTILGWAQSNPTNDQNILLYQIRGTDQYKTVFAGNDQRVKNGFTALSEAEYLSTKTAMRKTLQNFGLPNDFYGDSELNNLIGNDTSANEVASRAQDVWGFVNNANPGAKQALRDYYGVTDDASIAAYFLDPTRGQALIDQQAMAANLAGQASQSGLSINRSTAEGLAGTGKSELVLDSALKQAGDVNANIQGVASRFGQQFTGQDAVDAYAFGDPRAQQKVKQLTQSESALFQSGGSSLAQGSTSKGAF